MTHDQAGRYWERNAETWTLLSRQGWDLYRDLLNTPAFFSILPDVRGRTGLDIGCGEGHNTRLLAERGAAMVAFDISPTFAREAAAVENSEAASVETQPPIRYVAASAQQIPFAAASFDFATSFMCLMDLPDQPLAFHEIARVLRPGGFLQFSILHPCFNTPHRRLLRTPEGEAYAVEVGRYFERTNGRIERWIFSAAPAEVKAGLAPFEVPTFHRPLSDWISAILNAGLTIEQLAEPRADDATARAFPHIQDTQVVSYFLHVRCRKPPRI